MPQASHISMSVKYAFFKCVNCCYTFTCRLFNILHRIDGMKALEEKSIRSRQKQTWSSSTVTVKMQDVERKIAMELLFK